LFRSGFTLTRGKGPGIFIPARSRNYPTFYQKEIQTSSTNAVRWAAPAQNMPVITYRSDIRFPGYERGSGPGIRIARRRFPQDGRRRLMNVNAVNFEQMAGHTLERLRNGGALLTVRSNGAVNTMTIGWGSLSVYWGRPVFIVPVRLSRHTHFLLEQAEEFTVTVPRGDELRRALGYWVLIRAATWTNSRPAA
jgi:hypothetical protein